MINPPIPELIAMRRNLLNLLSTYAGLGTSEAVSAARFTELLREPDCAHRTRSSGHLTGSAWLVSADGSRALLMHHAKLQRWLQPGGHADGDLDLARVALTEAYEETGLTGLSVAPSIFDLDVHEIPARGPEPAHLHWDVRFVVRAGQNEAFVKNAESLDLAWVDIGELSGAPGTEGSVRRMAVKWLARPAPSRV